MTDYNEKDFELLDNYIWGHRAGDDWKEAYDSLKNIKELCLKLKTLDDNVKREIKEKKSIYEAMIKYEPMRIKHIKETLWEIEYLESLYKTKQA
jgi:hypothetical protein